MPKKLPSDKVDEIRRLYFDEGLSQAEVAKKTGTCPQSVCNYVSTKGDGIRRTFLPGDAPKVRLSDEYIRQVAERIKCHSSGYPEIALALHELLECREKLGTSITGITGDAKQWINAKETYKLHMKPNSKAR